MFIDVVPQTESEDEHDDLFFDDGKDPSETSCKLMRRDCSNKTALVSEIPFSCDGANYNLAYDERAVLIKHSYVVRFQREIEGDENPEDIFTLRLKLTLWDYKK